MDTVVFTQVLECDQVPVLLHRRADIGHPDLYAGNVDVGTDDGQFGQGPVISIPEKMGDEKVFVFLIIGRLEQKLAGLGAILDGDR